MKRTPWLVTGCVCGMVLGILTAPALGFSTWTPESGFRFRAIWIISATGVGIVAGLVADTLRVH